MNIKLIKLPDGSFIRANRVIHVGFFCVSEPKDMYSFSVDYQPLVEGDGIITKVYTYPRRDYDESEVEYIRTKLVSDVNDVDMTL